MSQILEYNSIVPIIIMEEAGDMYQKVCLNPYKLDLNFLSDDVMKYS